MTDSAYRAKNWLLRTSKLLNEQKKAANKVLLLESIVNSCTTNYESTGGHDPITAQARREEKLIDYSIAQAELSRITTSLSHENILTYKQLNKLSNIKFRMILTSRYIDGQSLTQLDKIRFLGYRKTKLYELELAALEALGAILDNNRPVIIPNSETKKKTIETTQEAAQVV